MKQITTEQTELVQEVTLDRSVGSLFADKLESKGRIGEFEKLSKRYNVDVNGDYLRLTPTSPPALVSEILKMVVKPDQEVKFFPAVAGG